MLRFLLGRLAVLIPTFIGVSIIAFSFIRLLPGDPIALLSGERVMSPERHAELSAQMGFDRPMIIQYFDYLWGVLRGDFGTSIVNKQPILEVLEPRLPARGTVLEIASGTGQHVVHFARALPRLSWQPSDSDADLRTAAAARIAAAALANVRPPLELDVCAEAWPVTTVDAVVCINMIHISPWAATIRS